MSDGQRHIVENPFFVLGVEPGAARAVVEREGQKLLAMLEVGLAKAKSYDTPLGARLRTPELVRWALAELRQPERRLVHELWAAVPVAAGDARVLDKKDEAPRPSPPPIGARKGEGEAGWPEARVAYGWEPRG